VWRSRELILGVLLLLGCSGSPTKPGSVFGDEILKMSRQPADGFCPREGAIYQVTVWKNAAGEQTLAGSVLIGYDALRDSCIIPVTSGRCLVEFPIEPRVLRADEAAGLWERLAAVPVEPHEINPACDPCLITRFEFSGRVEDINPCASASAEYRMRMEEVESFLRALLQLGE
jgi:hypothetical protein